MANPFDQFDEKRAVNPFDQFDAAMISGGNGIETPQAQSSSPTLRERMRADATKRGEQFAESMDRYRRGVQGATTTALQAAGNTLAGSAYDLAGNYIGSAARTVADITPEAIKAPIREAVSSAADTRLVRGAGRIAGWAGDAWDGFERRMPATAANIEAIANLTPAPTLLKGAGKGVVPIAKELNTRTIIPGADEIKQAASHLYQKADSYGGVLKPEFTNRFVDSIDRMRPQTEIGRAVGGDSPFTQLSGRLQAIRDKPMTLQAAQEVDEILGDAIDAQFQNGRLNKEGKRLLEAQTNFRNLIEGADGSLISGTKEGFEALKEGRRMWGVSRRMADVERIINNAENYQVPATAIKTGFRTLLQNPNRIRGYSPKEVRAMEKAARTGVVGDVLGVFGSRLGPLAAGASGLATLGPVGGAAAALGSYVGSTTARNAATALQKGRANAVTRAVAEQSGLVRQEPRLSLPNAPGFVQRNRAANAPAPQPLLLPGPGRARPMSDAEILASQQLLNRPATAKARTRPTRIDYGDVPYNVIAAEAPPQMLALPAPGTASLRAADVVVDNAGRARPMSDAEMEAISALRQRAQELGLSPDVINAQVMREAGDLSAVRGQSELGKMVADNPRITLEQLRNLSPKEARKLLTQSRKK